MDSVKSVRTAIALIKVPDGVPGLRTMVNIIYAFIA